VGSRHGTGAVLQARVLDGVRAVPADAWNALVGAGSPFLEWEWLVTLEDAGTVRPETGWLPQHLTLWQDETLIGACPLYVKGHSMGEFVFDQGWAHAAERAGMAYYPKLLVGVPFTPVAGARLLAAPGIEDTMRPLLAEAIEQLCREQQLSSVHVNFCLPEEAAALEERGWLTRTGWQYHWINQGYRSFDDYLAALRSKRRNQTRRDPHRRQHQHPGVDLVALLQRGAQRAVQPVLQVEAPVPLHDVREEVAVEGRILGEELVERQLALGGDQLIQAQRTGRNLRPLLERQIVLRVGTPVPDRSEDHDGTLPSP